MGVESHHAEETVRPAASYTSVGNLRPKQIHRAGGNGFIHDRSDKPGSILEALPAVFREAIPVVRVIRRRGGNISISKAAIAAS